MMSYFKDSLSRKNKYELAFELLRKNENNFLIKTDFVDIVSELVQDHEDYQMLKDTDDFREKFSSLKSHNRYRNSLHKIR